ncbi:peptide deformylase [Chloroflexota bacterium]
MCKKGLFITISCMILVLTGLALFNGPLTGTQEQTCLEILEYPNPILREDCVEVDVVDDEIRRLIDDMIATMEKNGAVGMAAPQVGVAKRVIVMQTQDGPRGFINPVILAKSNEEETAAEICMSIMGNPVEVSRARTVVVGALTREGEEIVMAVEGDEARRFQHEIDHVNGILVIDY